MDFISPFLNLVGSQLIAEYARIHGMSDKLNSWGEKLPWIQAFLDSAEEKQMYDNDSATVLWLADLRDVAYDMEDLLDHFSVEAKRAESKAQSSKLPHCHIACIST
ncbi:hypothetical protein MLD38_037116 [Melastoma candidum]|uniref:Uncharacterized protein n=1 Tax=Melastoma candidum TaxID=119954 RepID=A0ACB9LM18_9MYRT|nr:hypothetical protein MLD38_037116 [Melastoma candidum]